VRALALAGDTKALLALCDSLRDDVMTPLGVKLEDGAAATDGGAAGSRWKLRAPAELQRELDAKRAAAEARAGAKAEAAAEAARKNAEKEAKAALDAGVMFRQGEAAAAYSAWDAEGVPTHDAAGAELGKGDKKRLRKEWELQKKLNDWLAAKKGGAAE
jgi:cysteinyl-tRNA synthetase